MRTLPILASRRSPGASFKLPISLSPRILALLLRLFRFSLPPSAIVFSAVLVVERLSPGRERERSIYRSCSNGSLKSALSCNTDRRAVREFESVGNKSIADNFANTDHFAERRIVPRTIEFDFLYPMFAVDIAGISLRVESGSHSGNQAASRAGVSFTPSRGEEDCERATAIFRSAPAFLFNKLRAKIYRERGATD